MKDPGKTLNTCIARLKEQGVRMTHQRLEILREVVSSRGHPSIAEVHEAVKKRIPTLALDTVYRTMKRLAEMGLIHPVGYASDGIRYDADPTPHHHFLCSFCGEAYDFTSPELDSLQVPRVARELGEVRGYRMEIRGVCRNCLKKGKEEFHG